MTTWMENSTASNGLALGKNPTATLKTQVKRRMTMRRIELNIELFSRGMLFNFIRANRSEGNFNN